MKKLKASQQNKLTKPIEENSNTNWKGKVWFVDWNARDPYYHTIHVKWFNHLFRWWTRHRTCRWSGTSSGRYWQRNVGGWRQQSSYGQLGLHIIWWCLWHFIKGCRRVRHCRRSCTLFTQCSLLPLQQPALLGRPFMMTLMACQELASSLLCFSTFLLLLGSTSSLDSGQKMFFFFF